MYSNFLLGKLCITDNAKLKLKRTPLDLIARHAVCDHGHISRRELKLNALGMKTYAKIISRYDIDPTDPAQGRVVVVTDECWESTTVKLESEP